MNRALLDQLQQLRSFPSVTVLFNTTPGTTPSDDEQATGRRLISEAAARLGDADPDGVLLEQLETLFATQIGQRAGHAVALCASAEHATAVSLGSEVDERVVVDDTFATRDLVADLNRTASYRVVTVSEALVRVFVGDRARLVEERTDTWPLEREDDQNDTQWSRLVSDRLQATDADFHLPTVLAGVKRSTSRIVDDSDVSIIGEVAGNRDRAGAAELHTLVWPVVLDWMGQRQSRALDELDAARSAKLYASGIDEIWQLAADKRIELLVVERGYALAAHIDDNGHLDRSGESGGRMTDDVIDEAIEAVLQSGGAATMVANGVLADHGHIAAVLRY